MLHTYRGPAASVRQALSMGSGWVDVPGEPAKGRVGSLVGGAWELCRDLLARFAPLAFSSLYFCFLLPSPKCFFFFFFFLNCQFRMLFVADVCSRCMEEEEENKRFRYLSNLCPVKNC